MRQKPPYNKDKPHNRHRPHSIDLFMLLTTLTGQADHTQLKQKLLESTHATLAGMLIITPILRLYHDKKIPLPMPQAIASQLATGLSITIVGATVSRRINDILDTTYDTPFTSAKLKY